MENRPRVCHLSSVHVALDTRLFYRYCLSLVAYYEVTLIAVHPRGETIQGVRIIPFRRFRNKLLRVLVTWLLMWFKALKQNARIYHIHDPELIPCGLLLRMIGKKVIYDVHENVAEDIFDKPWIRRKSVLAFFYGVFEKLAVRSMKIILAEYSYEDRFRKLGADFSTVLNFPDLTFFESYRNTRRNGNRIFYIGILLETRGILEIAEALNILKNQHNHTVHFDIVGELYSDLAGKLERLPFYQDIRSQMHFHGRLSLEAGYALSRNAAAGICIIYPMKNSVGSYPTKMFEYMAIGLPQVLSDFPLYRSVVEDHACGICVDPHNPAAIAAAVADILDNPDKARGMSEAGVRESVKYSWSSQFVKVQQVYQQLLGPSQSRQR